MELSESLSRSGEPVPSQFNSVGTLIPCFLKFLFNNVLPSDLPVRFLAKILYSFFVFVYATCPPILSFISWTFFYISFYCTTSLITDYKYT